MNTNQLNILMNGLLVGKIRKKLNKGGLIFTYEKQWLETPEARPISLSLPLVSQSFTGDIVYNFFLIILLPDNYQIRERIQAKFHAKNQSTI